MKRILFCISILTALSFQGAQAKDLVAYFSAEGHTRAVAERIAQITGADLYFIEPAEPYASNPYDDSDRIQNEAYNDLRPAVADLPSQEWIDSYDRIFVGSPCWWHQPAMVVCTFLENYDLSRHVIIPFITYGATTYLNESMQKIYRCTPESVHVPATLPEDLDPDDITRPGRPDDAGIGMPGNAAGTDAWLRALGIHPEASVGSLAEPAPVSVSSAGGVINISLPQDIKDNTVEIYRPDGSLLRRMSDSISYSLYVPEEPMLLLSLVYDRGQKRVSRKIIP